MTVNDSSRRQSLGNSGGAVASYARIVVKVSAIGRIADETGETVKPVFPRGCRGFDAYEERWGIEKGTAGGSSGPWRVFYFKAIAAMAQ